MIIVLCLLITLVWGIEFFINKNRFSAITYIWAGVFFPLYMYELKWSKFINESQSFYFNYIFVMLTIIVIIYTFTSFNKKPLHIAENEKIVITEKGRFLIFLLNIVFVLFYLIENYLGSGMFFPGLNHIDIHTYSAPVISYITNAPFIVLASNYYAFKATKKKKYLFYIGVDMLIPVLTRSSRMQAMIGVIQLGSLILFFESGTMMKSLKTKKMYRRFRNALLIGVFAFGIALMYFTNYRMNHYGVYKLNYADIIGYNGPEWLNFLAPYYGYFPLSFNNLKINLLHRTVTHNYIGLYSFSCIYFGVFQLDNLIGLNTRGQLIGQLVTNSAATVPTGFWDFYYDYGFLCFIPMVVAMLICNWLLKMAKKEKHRLTYRTLYFWYIPLWFFMSFQNVIFGTTLLVVGILMHFIIKNSFRIEKKNEEIK